MVTDNNLHPWTDEAFADLGVEKPVVFDDVDGLDFEQISDCNPDVILAAYSGMTQEDYDTLSHTRRRLGRQAGESRLSRMPRVWA